MNEQSSSPQKPSEEENGGVNASSSGSNGNPLPTPPSPLRENIGEEPTSPQVTWTLNSTTTTNAGKSSSSKIEGGGINNNNESNNGAVGGGGGARRKRRALPPIEFPAAAGSSSSSVAPVLMNSRQMRMSGGGGVLLNDDVTAAMALSAGGIRPSSSSGTSAAGVASSSSSSSTSFVHATSDNGTNQRGNRQSHEAEDDDEEDGSKIHILQQRFQRPSPPFNSSPTSAFTPLSTPPHQRYLHHHSTPPYSNHPQSSPTSLNNNNNPLARRSPSPIAMMPGPQTRRCCWCFEIQYDSSSSSGAGGGRGNNRARGASSTASSSSSSSLRRQFVCLLCLALVASVLSIVGILLFFPPDADTPGASIVPSATRFSLDRNTARLRSRAAATAILQKINDAWGGEEEGSLEEEKETQAAIADLFSSPNPTESSSSDKNDEVNLHALALSLQIQPSEIVASRVRTAEEFSLRNGIDAGARASSDNSNEDTDFAFYFLGYDYVNPRMLFPRATTYLLIGTYPAGEASLFLKMLNSHAASSREREDENKDATPATPATPDGAVNEELEAARVLSTMTTQDLISEGHLTRSTLVKSRKDGGLGMIPVLIASILTTGDTILEVKSRTVTGVKCVRIVIASSSNAKGPPTRVLVYCGTGAGDERDDDSFEPVRRGIALLKRLRKPSSSVPGGSGNNNNSSSSSKRFPTLIRHCNYAMFEGVLTREEKGLNRARAAILSLSSRLVQDDSGFPVSVALSHFSRSAEFFGRYFGFEDPTAAVAEDESESEDKPARKPRKQLPGAVLRSLYQPILFKLYSRLEATGKRHHLPFHFGSRRVVASKAEGVNSTASGIPNNNNAVFVRKGDWAGSHLMVFFRERRGGGEESAAT